MKLKQMMILLGFAWLLSASLSANTYYFSDETVSEKDLHGKWVLEARGEQVAHDDHFHEEFLNLVEYNDQLTKEFQTKGFTPAVSTVKITETFTFSMSNGVYELAYYVNGVKSKVDDANLKWINDNSASIIDNFGWSMNERDLVIKSQDGSSYSIEASWVFESNKQKLYLKGIGVFKRLEL